ncbi:tumor necrosis factor receptor superfamily member 1B isoform X4 [Mauremys mutica]|uniref:tumor necrosis factor receptor superfamily member 1B isoform X4 n=1 Tax=Mauremys mutica TaxID=74926 RepID=UPI001D16E57F|nr:tumor necrosis factor receptor superfamily member 1B isoform X4 [Mauremys mutica]
MGPGWLVGALLLPLLHLHVGGSQPGKNYLLPYTWKTPECKDPDSEYYEENINKCCSKCSPGYRMLQSCNSSADTQCAPCDENTYTRLWNRARRCLGCSSPCNSGTNVTNTECSPCRPGTFSDEESSTASCKPHSVCQSVSVAGSNTSDTVCSDSKEDVSVTATSPHTTTPSTGQPIAASSIKTNAVQLSPDVSQTIGIIVGLTSLVLIVVAGVACCIVSRKRAPDLPFLCPPKQPEKRPRDTGAQSTSGPKQEEQHLLETPGSSSSSLDNTASGISIISINTEKKETERTQQRRMTSEGCNHHSGARPGSASSEHSASGGTQVNVTCIVNLCNSNHSPQFPEPTTSTTTDYENVSYCTPTEEEIPLSKEENPLKRESEIQISVEAADSLPPSLSFPEVKPFPLSVQDAGMKNS